MALKFWELETAKFGPKDPVKIFVSYGIKVFSNFLSATLG